MNKLVAYKLYTSIRQHFSTSSYDFFKYRGKFRGMSIEFLEKRKDKYKFYDLAKKFPREKDLVMFLVYNQIEFNCYNFDMSENFYEWKKKIEAFQYYFKQELFEYSRQHGNILKCIKNFDNNYPILFKHYLQKEITTEFLLALNEVINFFGKWDSKINDPLLWPREYEKLKSYRRFFIEFTEFKRENFVMLIRDTIQKSENKKIKNKEKKELCH